MPKAAPTVGNTLDQLLAEACERNVSVELYFERSEGPAITARARLLELTDEHILADRPACADTSTHIPAGRKITVHAAIRGLRYQFDSVIEDSATWVQLNSKQRVSGIALRKPTQIKRSERRGQFRVSLVGIEPIAVELVRGHPEVLEACVIHSGSSCGRMVNISGGGAAVLVERRYLRAAKRGDRFFLSFKLPGIADEFCLLGNIRHVLNVQASESIRLAFSFQQWGSRRYSQDQRQLTRFVSEQERRLLRMRK